MQHAHTYTKHDGDRSLPTHEFIPLASLTCGDDPTSVHDRVEGLGKLRAKIGRGTHLPAQDVGKLAIQEREAGRLWRSLSLVAVSQHREPGTRTGENWFRFSVQVLGSGSRFMVQVHGYRSRLLRKRRVPWKFLYCLGRDTSWRSGESRKLASPSKATNQKAGVMSSGEPTVQKER